MNNDPTHEELAVRSLLAEIGPEKAAKVRSYCARHRTTLTQLCKEGFLAIADGINANRKNQSAVAHTAILS